MNLTTYLDRVEIRFKATSADATGAARPAAAAANKRFMKNNPARNDNGEVFFKSFLEDASEQFIIAESPLQAAPLASISESIVTKLGRKVRLVFNVMSEDRREAFINYQKLFDLIEMLKPMYFLIGRELVPANKNIFGLVHLQFSGLPILQNWQLITPTNFSYEINKDLGYIHMPFDETYDETRYTSDKNMQLVPIAFRLTFEGKVNLNMYDTASIMTQQKYYEVMGASTGTVMSPSRREGDSGIFTVKAGKTPAAEKAKGDDDKGGGAAKDKGGGGGGGGGKDKGDGGKGKGDRPSGRDEKTIAAAASDLISGGSGVAFGHIADKAKADCAGELKSGEQWVVDMGNDPKKHPYLHQIAGTPLGNKLNQVLDALPRDATAADIEYALRRQDKKLVDAFNKILGEMMTNNVTGQHPKKTNLLK